MFWRRREPQQPVWTDFEYLSVCDYRGASILVHVCGGPDAWAWKVYRRQDYCDLELDRLEYFRVHKTEHATDRDDAKDDAVRNLDKYLDSRESNRHGAPA